ncbi:MAG: hypothetical protein OIF34_00760 [Porticoccaceae bacterium]|nr:hypothetical protein [Porticoccaceae bacterium]
MKILGSTTLLLLAFATSSALADSDTYRGDRHLLDNRANYHGDLLAHGGDRHYRTDRRRHHKKYRKHRKYHRNYRNNYRHNYRHDRRRHNYDYHLDFHVYPYYNKRHYRQHKRHYRRDYRRNYRHRGYRCDYRDDGLKWLAGAVVASELLHYAFDNPQDEWHYSDHRDYRGSHWEHSDDHAYIPTAAEVDHEQHYRRYHTAKYGG